MTRKKISPLPAPVVREGWKADFHKAFIDALIKLGSELDEHADIYGWMVYGEDSHRLIALHGVDYTRCTYERGEWMQFRGTFTDTSYVIGVDATIVLANGHTIPWRCSSTIGEIIEEVVNA